MAYNKIVLKGQTLIDLTSDTVSADKLAKGVTAHDKTGAPIVGTMSSGGGGADPGRFGANYDFWIGVVDANGKLDFIPSSNPVDLVFTGVKDVGSRVFNGIFYLRNSGRINSASFPDLEYVTGGYAFNQAFSWNSGITSISFPKLKHISGEHAFYRICYVNSKLTEVSFPSLLTVTGGLVFYGAFANNANLTSLSFPVLTQIGSDTQTSWANGGETFREVVSSPNKCTTLSFPELTTIYCTGNSNSNGTFVYNDTLQRIDFPKLSVIDKSPAYTGSVSLVAHKNIFYGCSKLTEIHFGAANQAAIEATEGYPTLWGRGAGNATVYFDL